MVNWTYNDIDVYLSSSDNILGETSVNTTSWVPLSTYGLLRSRVALTPSTVEGTAITVPGRDGKTYSTDSGRGNAKIEFEILIADEWAHRTAEATANMTVRQRADMVAALLNNVRRVAYKQPGRTADSYFMVYKTTQTFQDADEKAFVINVQMEVHPFEFYLSGNAPIVLGDHGVGTYANSFPNSECRPTYVIGNASSGIITLTKQGASSYFNYIRIRKPISQDAGNEVVLDSFLQLIYSKSSIDNMNSYIDGDVQGVRFPQGITTTISNLSAANVTVYPRGGIVR